MNNSSTSTSLSQPTRAALYVRSALENKSGPGNNVNRQLNRLRAFVHERKWTLQGVYKDKGFSGLDENRPGLNQLLEACHDGHIDVVVVTDLARLSHSVSHVIYVIRQFRLLKVSLVGLDGGELVTTTHFSKFIGVSLSPKPRGDFKSVKFPASHLIGGTL